ncbi:MAG: hypothetical protein U0694_28715 [Anaerolineae bacterium]
MADVNTIMYVVTRNPIPPGQLTIYKVLFDAGDDWISQQELAADATRGNVVALNGALRGLANRVHQTSTELKQANQGYELMIEKVERDGQWFYRMTPALRSVIECLPQLHEAMTLSVEDIRKKFEKMSSWLVIDSAG